MGVKWNHRLYRIKNEITVIIRSDLFIMWNREFYNIKSDFGYSVTFPWLYSK